MTTRKISASDYLLGALICLLLGWNAHDFVGSLKERIRRSYQHDVTLTSCFALQRLLPEMGIVDGQCAAAAGKVGAQ